MNLSNLMNCQGPIMHDPAKPVSEEMTSSPPAQSAAQSRAKALSGQGPLGLAFPVTRISAAKRLIALTIRRCES